MPEIHYADSVTNAGSPSGSPGSTLSFETFLSSVITLFHLDTEVDLYKFDSPKVRAFASLRLQPVTWSRGPMARSMAVQRAGFVKVARPWSASQHWQAGQAKALSQWYEIRCLTLRLRSWLPCDAAVHPFSVGTASSQLVTVAKIQISGFVSPARTGGSFSLQLAIGKQERCLRPSFCLCFMHAINLVRPLSVLHRPVRFSVSSLALLCVIAPNAADRPGTEGIVMTGR